MNFETWEPVYEAILADMGYDRAGDERARDELESLVADRTPLEPDPDAFAGETVVVAAPGPGLTDDEHRLLDADRVVAAGVAADRLFEVGLPVDWIVTDLDGHAAQVREFTADGLPVAVHAHGDNRDLVAEYVPTYDLAAVLPTTQAAPAGPVVNVGGFTDGDRAAFMADALGAARITFAGWDFDDPTVTDEKRRKLRWAARLLYWLEHLRGEPFAVLDGRRSSIDVSMLPLD